jgi:tetratricopeptide (TPR) repeat protein
MNKFATAADLALPLILSLGLSAPVFAAGSSDSAEPKSTKTTIECEGVQVWDKEEKECVDPEETNLDDDTLYDAVRELAYAGRHLDAIGVMDAMSDQNDDRVLTYKGFTNRKLGNVDVAMVFYQKAIDKNPDNILARSYMGQGMMDQGNKIGAVAQLREINARGGADTWAALSLSNAIATGITYSH